MVNQHTAVAERPLNIIYCALFPALSRTVWALAAQEPLLVGLLKTVVRVGHRRCLEVQLLMVVVVVVEVVPAVMDLEVHR
jgi:hypothetical protein